MLAEAKSFIRFLENHKRNHSDIEEIDGNYVVRLGLTGDNAKVSIVVIFDGEDDAHTVAIRCFDFVNITDAQMGKAMVVCNEINSRKRWVKFYISEDNGITIEDDAIVDAASAGEEIYELVMRMAIIADEEYPAIMKAIWA